MRLRMLRQHPKIHDLPLTHIWSVQEISVLVRWLLLGRILNGTLDEMENVQFSNQSPRKSVWSYSELLIPIRGRKHQNAGVGTS